MPSKLYNNKTLAEQESKRGLGVSIEAPTAPQNDDPYVNEPSVDQLLRESQGALDGYDDLSGVASIPDRLASIQRPTHGMARQVTDGLEHMAGPLGLAAMIPSPVQPFAAAGAGIGFGLGGLRKLIMPEEDESRTGGAIQTGLAALPYGIAPAARLAQATWAGRAARAGAPVAERYAPSVSGYAGRAAGAADEAAEFAPGSFRSATADVDPFMPNSSGYRPSSVGDDIERIATDHPAIDRYAPSKSGYVRETPHTVRPDADVPGFDLIDDASMPASAGVPMPTRAPVVEAPVSSGPDIPDSWKQFANGDQKLPRSHKRGSASKLAKLSQQRAAEKAAP